MGANMQTQLAIDAIEFAALRGCISPGSVFHSDRDVQFRSIKYGQALAESKSSTRWIPWAIPRQRISSMFIEPAVYEQRPGPMT